MCAVEAPKSCVLPWGGSVTHGQKITAFNTATVSHGQSCLSQERVCSNGVLSGTYSYRNCSAVPALGCSLPWGGSLVHGAQITAFQSPAAAFGQSCGSQVRVCNNGVLSGTYNYQACINQPPAGCSLPWGGAVTHGQTVTAYEKASVSRGEECKSQVRLCSNGQLSGNYSSLSCSLASTPFTDLGIGFNHPYLIPDVVADNRYSADERDIRMQMNRRSIQNAYKIGVNHIVVFLGSAYPTSQHDFNAGKNQYLLWQQNPTAYWDRVEEIFEYIHSYRLKVIARGWGQQYAFPTLVTNVPGNSKETMRDFVTNPNSKSYQMYKSYWTQFLTRFKNKSYLLAVGGINELNLLADLDRIEMCRQEYPTSFATRCSSMGNFTTDELIAFNHRVVNDIFKQIAPNIPTISGNAIPRDSAENLRADPQFGSGNGLSRWCKDSRIQFEKNLKEINAPFDYVDMHIYNPAEGGGVVRFTGESRPNCSQVAADPRGSHAAGSANFVTYVNNYVRSIGKKLYVGEFGDSSVPANGHNQFVHTTNIVQLMGINGFHSGSIWALEFYQMNTHEMQRMNMDYSNPLAEPLFSVISSKANGPLLFSKDLAVMISHPIHGRKYTNPFVVNALVDRTSSPVKSVKIYISNVLVQTITSWPYKATITPATYGSGLRSIKVVVEDHAGKMAEKTIQVEF